MYAEVELQSPALQETLLIPRTAVLETGERSVVFHRMAGGQLHPMDVVTGLKSGDEVQVLSGLKEGDTVVASATFLIDAESNLGAALAGMAGMAGMDHSGMDMGDEEGGETMDQMDHSQHQMPEAAPDTSEARMDQGQMDHSGHSMPGMAADTAARPDTTAQADRPSMRPGAPDGRSRSGGRS
jgi:Cu(I)/Ag(I) efflux system membrane fusion protein